MFRTQPTIDSFFGNNYSKINPGSKIELKRYFYLNWSDKYSPVENAYWTDTKPEKINYIDQVKCDYIKKGYYFNICGNFSGNDEREFYLSKEKVYKNTAYMKSLLQKSIRKMNGELAVQSTYHLFKLGLNDLMRRLPIIMLEDARLHESFTTLIWLMVATGQNSNFEINKFQMKQYIYEWLLGTVYMIAMNPDIDLDYDYDSELEDNGMDNCKQTKEDNQTKDKKLPVYEILNTYNNLDRNELSLLYCIHIRIAYGGMKCDLDMLNRYSDIWKLRFESKEIKNYYSKIEVSPICIYIKELELSEWDISAIDYHCSPKLIELINKKYDEFDENEIKKVIWYHSSSTNKRKSSEEYNSKLWLKIKNYVERTQKYLLESGY
jgi:hypothetical protein